ncbi:hypothetical protein HMPREF1613_04139 [Escherichia coli 908616]|nr:hypothetical protein HMPREF1599_05010 [Escherichia coli 907713]ESA95239.1 hypothetical protein HMPREF1619_05990 [Klebsiella pneumoniae 909957]ESD20244.1 hypothetical protein HMPREF1600_04533 [Escherichia coli 907715]ESD48636.1 hypothetical protein HMPREF1606_04876 [Escherichia coli 908522]ESD49631.1 hypothetical protein HMPREF1605_03786 [Escherichia coli 908521]ESD84189.1 hypothetical protein HMPREF1613_04139 [Escherichia coli 908616]ESE08136.1 hypothetical protein HMPREF1616_01404 [Escher
MSFSSICPTTFSSRLPSFIYRSFLTNSILFAGLFMSDLWCTDCKKGLPQQEM